MGSDAAYAFPDDGEGPIREVYLSAFRIDPKAVTNREFATFLKDTGYVTEAERFGWSFIFYQFVDPADRGVVLDRRLPLTGPPWFEVTAWR